MRAVERGLLSMEQDKILFFSVTTKSIPKGIPMIAANTAEIESMYKVSAKLFKSKLIIVGDISDHLACNR